MNGSLKTFTAKQARDNFTDILGMVYYGNQPVLIEKKGRPFAVIISPQEYEQIDYWKSVKRVQKRNADKKESEVMADVTAEVEVVRQKIYEQKSAKPQAVVDTNIIVSGLIFKKGSSNNVIEALRNGKFNLIISEPLFSEYKLVLPREKFTIKYQLTEEEITDFIILVETLAQKIDPLNKLPVTVRDAKDEIVLKAALGGKADYLVTGDEDLLILNGNPALGKLKIISAQNFLKIL